MKTKKTLVLLCLASLWIQSCSDNKNSESESTDKKEEMCDCSQITKGKGKYKGKAVKGDTLIYTGKCQKLDKYDSLIKEVEYLNGEAIHVFEKQKIFNSYAVIRDLIKNEHGDIVSGSQICGISGLSDKIPGCKFTEAVEEWKDNKCINKWGVRAIYIAPYKDGDGNPNNGTLSLTFKYEIKNGEGNIDNKKVGRPKNWNNSKFIEAFTESYNLQLNGTGLSAGSASFEAGNCWTQDIIIDYNTKSFDEVFKIFEGFKSEVPNFNFYLEK